MICSIRDLPEIEVQTPALGCHVLDTGFCSILENHLITSGRRIRVPVHATAALLRHPVRGWFLFDTGYAPRIFAATASLPFRLYRWVTPLTVTENLAVVTQLRRFGLAPEDIATIVLSHFHADHIAGLLDFPQATLVAGREAWEAVRGLSSLRALARGFLSGLMPDDFQKRLSAVENFDGPDVSPFGQSHDLFSDGSALLVRLPGHARGQLGLLAKTVHGRIFFAADSYWMPSSLTHGELPHRITRFFGVDNWDAMTRTVQEVGAFARSNPDVKVLSTHCPESFRYAMEVLP